MPKNTRVLHVVKGFTMPMRQVIKRIEDNCSFVWVEYGRTFRDATPAEAMKMRMEQIKLDEALPFAEIPGLVWQHEDSRSESRLAAEANRFAAQTAIQ